jgi:hypothetical protein
VYNTAIVRSDTGEIRNGLEGIQIFNNNKEILTFLRFLLIVAKPPGRGDGFYKRIITVCTGRILKNLIKLNIIKLAYYYYIVNNNIHT